MPAGDAAGEELVEQGVAQALGGADDRLGALDGLVDGVQHGQAMADAAVPGVVQQRIEIDRMTFETDSTSGDERYHLQMSLRNVPPSYIATSSTCE